MFALANASQILDDLLHPFPPQQLKVLERLNGADQKIIQPLKSLTSGWQGEGMHRSARTLNTPSDVQSIKADLFIRSSIVRIREGPDVS
jgi:hypothetical protein